MIPKICANCTWGTPITSAMGDVQIVICNYMPLAISEYPSHSCGCFQMAENPQIVMNDSEPVSEGDSNE